jgi:hypothetical protein
MLSPVGAALFAGFFAFGAGIVAAYRGYGRFGLAAVVGGIAIIVGATAAAVLP